ncbi:MAG: sugar phosphate isomerase/epimerase [Spirochaetales bacterium]|nr:sugar phosphate isomerase/epimerase [Spirochaetales bacterium]
MNTLIYTGEFGDGHRSLFPGLKAMGYDGVEIALGAKGDFDTGKMLGSLEENGLVCSSICGLYGPGRDMRGSDAESIRGGIEYTKDCIDVASELKAELVVGPLYSVVGRANLETEEDRKSQWALVVDGLKESCEHAEKKGISLGLEPLNRFETDFINITDDALRMVSDVGSERLGLHLDTFHMSHEEKNSAEAIRRAGKHLFHVHASENDRGTPGTGQVPWDAIAKALADINYDRWVVIESFTPEVKVIAKAASIWRPTEKDADTLARKGLQFLTGLFA